jgi:hypothetical protein
MATLTNIDLGISWQDIGLTWATATDTWADYSNGLSGLTNVTA